MKAPLISASGFGKVTLGAAMLLATANAFADAPGAHPAYLHARSDLRRAELLMQRRDEPNVMRDWGRPRAKLMRPSARSTRRRHGTTKT